MLCAHKIHENASATSRDECAWTAVISGRQLLWREAIFRLFLDDLRIGSAKLCSVQLKQTVRSRVPRLSYSMTDLQQATIPRGHICICIEKCTGRVHKTTRGPWIGASIYRHVKEQSH